MVALSASRLVWSAMLLISLTTSPIFLCRGRKTGDDGAGFVRLLHGLLRRCVAHPEAWRLISPTDAASSSAPVATACMLDDAWVEVDTAEVTRSDVVATASRNRAQIAVDGLLDVATPDAVLHLLGRVDGEFDDLDDLAVGVADRVVGALDPDRTATIADTFVLAGLIFSATQGVPERTVLRTVADRPASRTCCDACPGSPPAGSPWS